MEFDLAPRMKIQLSEVRGQQPVLVIDFGELKMFLYIWNESRGQSPLKGVIFVS